MVDQHPVKVNVEGSNPSPGAYADLRRLRSAAYDAVDHVIDKVMDFESGGYPHHSWTPSEPPTPITKTEAYRTIGGFSVLVTVDKIRGV